VYRNLQAMATYSISSEPNESGIVNRQSGANELKYILKFYIGVRVT